MKSTKGHFFNRLLFLYGTVSALALTLASLTDISPGNLVATLLFLPVPAYFVMEIVGTIGDRVFGFINLNQGEFQFSLRAFFTQSETAFIVTVILLALAFALTLFRQSIILIQ